MEYLGHLSKKDPLHEFIRKKLPGEKTEEYRVFRLRASNDVYLYEETCTRRRVIGKFFYHGRKDRASAHATLCRESANLDYIRSLGFDGGGYHYVARPLGTASELNELLLEEYCYGETLTEVLSRTFRSGNTELLNGKLTALAYFLSCFHNRTANGEPVDFHLAAEYARRLLQTLRSKNAISEERKAHFGTLLERWFQRPEMWSDHQVAVHGDATPENFLFGDGLHVISFDLERLQYADRLFDVGRLAAELAHAFMLNTGDRFRAEPSLGHFLWEYSCHFPDRKAAFDAITRRLPFYMGINFLRIARNDYFDGHYRRRLIRAAEDCLSGGLA